MGISKIKDNLFMKVVDNDVIIGKLYADVALAFRFFERDIDVEPGLGTKMWLIVDAKCISSVTDTRS
ncbi:hypothetical protein PVAG01_10486 [Phlyctema vagabunda]|uniref:Uncharacterized protein n=1 Tax=Phlyctema vagabunda TaxID=108571 RepID=A0ABR4P2G0_9HELO